MVKQSPIFVGCDLTGREYHSMEWHIIFAHELVQVDLAWVSPPVLIVIA